MLGNCLVRNPLTRDQKIDAGAFCEALLFFSKTHVVLDQATLGLFVNASLLDEFIEMLKRGYITANYAPVMPVLYSSSAGGVREHMFTIIRTGGDQKTGRLERSADAMLFQLENMIGDKGKAKRYYRDLCRYVSFKDSNDQPIVAMGAQDLTDPAFARTIATMSLLNFGVPAQEINFKKLDVMPLGGGRFAVATDLNFSHLQKFVPSEPQFGVNHLFPAIGDARLDISLAARHNAAFIGNDRNQEIIELILKRAIGTQANHIDVTREIYDFISVDTPSLRAVVNSGERTVADFLKLREKAGAFKNWLEQQNPDKKLIEEMLREKIAGGWMDSLPVKVARFAIFNGGSVLANVIMPGAGLPLNAVNSFLIDRLAKKWRPHFFVENSLRGFLDTKS